VTSAGRGGGSQVDRPGDDELVAAAQAGDRAAMEALLDRHYDRIAAIATRMLRHRADAEDATQQALLAIVRGLDRFDGRAAASTWIHRVTVNACLDEIRRRGRRDQPVEAVEELGSPAAVTSRASGLAETVADRVDVDRALARIGPDFRAAVVLRDLCGLDYEEIARVLEIPPGTARSRISRGRRLLGEALGNPTSTPDVQGIDP
jgi:RNA polymerase sigma-70 factor (ECF subfamily)